MPNVPVDDILIHPRERDLVIRTMRDYFTQDIDEVWIDSQDTYDRALEFVSDVMPAKAKIIKLHTDESSSEATPEDVAAAVDPLCEVGVERDGVDRGLDPRQRVRGAGMRTVRHHRWGAGGGSGRQGAVGRAATAEQQRGDPDDEDEQGRCPAPTGSGRRGHEAQLASRKSVTRFFASASRSSFAGRASMRFAPAAPVLATSVSARPHSLIAVLAVAGTALPLASVATSDPA
jgi:hypothetical protein